MVLAVLESR